MAGVETTHRAQHSKEDLRGLDAASRPAGFEGYDAARTGAAVYERGPRGILAIAGRDAVSFLHGILTNDILHLAVGDACYGAYLTPQGRMLADMDVLRRAGDLWLDVEPGVREDLARRFDQSLFTEDVRILDRSDELRTIGVYGPGAGPALASALAEAGAPGDLPSPNRHTSSAVEGGDLVVLATDRGGIPGFHVFGPPQMVETIAASAIARGAVPLGVLAAESLRIEAGLPRFGTDMTDDTIPLEAGIEKRAISMTKGCYVGQEVIVRILHRGHGRVARRLVGLHIDGTAVPDPGARLVHDERDVGFVTSAVVSPRLGPIGLAYVHRDFIQPGTQLRLEGDGRSVTVSPLPFGADE
ncbi:MAG TPA: glycine cleavage T C-terminal barrel domain-containing protein [Vicinamibacterales bacterium]|nr:glycine cleavage T C-terminal barrel domain-containing protein [Vicinamibacterales bacterium]